MAIVADVRAPIVWTCSRLRLDRRLPRCCAHWPCFQSSANSSPPCADDGGDQRHDNRHDDAHGAWPHRTQLVADRFEVACYVLVVLAAAIRVFGGIVLPTLTSYGRRIGRLLVRRIRALRRALLAGLVATATRRQTG